MLIDNVGRYKLIINRYFDNKIVLSYHEMMTKKVLEHVLDLYEENKVLHPLNLISE